MARLYLEGRLVNERNLIKGVYIKRKYKGKKDKRKLGSPPPRTILQSFLSSILVELFEGKIVRGRREDFGENQVEEDRRNPS